VLVDPDDSTNVDFKFDGSFRQIDDEAMGTPLGPILADLFLAYLESGSMSPIVNKATFYARYINDTFLLLNQDQNPEALLDELNKMHLAHKFTMEIEKEDS